MIPCLFLLAFRCIAASSETFNLAQKFEWQYVTVSTVTHLEKFVLIQIQRIGDGRSRELLVAAYGHPEAQFSEGKWQVSAEFADIEGWTQGTAHHSLQVPLRPLNLTVGLYSSSLSANNHYVLVVTFHDGEDCPGDCSQLGKCEKGECQCNKGAIGRECDFSAVAIEPNTDVVVHRESNLLYFRPEDDGKLVLRTMEDYKSISVYTLQQGDVYGIPSLEYYSQVSLVPTPKQKAQYDCIQGVLVILLIDSPSFPVVLTISIESTSSSSSISSVTIGLIVGLSWLCIFIVAGVLLWRCCKRKKKPEEVQIIPNEPFGVRMSLKVSQQVVEELDARFPISRFASLKNPMCLSCRVCLEPFALASEVRTLTCKHSFHSHCLNVLFSQKKRCCVCNRDYDSPTPPIEVTTVENTSDVQHASSVSHTAFINQDSIPC